MDDREQIISNFLEVKLKKPDDFLRVRETLSRIGLTKKGEKVLIQTCHIFHKQGKYYITHFLELYKLDKREAKMNEEDFQRRNRIARLLHDWGLLEIINPESFSDMIPLNRIKILPYEEKDDWSLRSMYSVGKKF